MPPINLPRGAVALLKSATHGPLALLVLIASMPPERTSVARLADALGVSGSTATRWLTTLRDARLIRYEATRGGGGGVKVAVLLGADEAVKGSSSESLTDAPWSADIDALRAELSARLDAIEAVVRAAPTTSPTSEPAASDADLSTKASKTEKASTPGPDPSVPPEMLAQALEDASDGMTRAEIERRLGVPTSTLKRAIKAAVRSGAIDKCGDGRATYYIHPRHNPERRQTHIDSLVKASETAPDSEQPAD